jgi:hypothetical protein
MVLTQTRHQTPDYIGSLCVTGAKRTETKEKRLAQMLDELEGGRLYMNMKWHSKG